MMQRDKCTTTKHGTLRRRGGFTAVELLVVLGIVVILLSIFIPYLLSIRESSNRNACARNLLQIRAALQAYANDNDKNFPRVRYAEQENPNGYVAFSGPDDPNPFAPDSTVHPNDVTASLWLLVRGGYLRDLRVFVCPSSDDRSDRLTDASGRSVEPAQRSNFRSPSNLSYSYASPFSGADDYRLNSDWVNKDFALIADRNPGTHRLRSATTLPSSGSRPQELAAANSRNHRGAGQNVVYGDTRIEFRTTPYCGMEQDNVYTALTRRPLLPGEKPPPDDNGYVGQDVAPSWYGDSYLVPIEGDVAPTARSAPATQPTTAPAEAPATVPAEEPVPATTTPATTAPATTAP